MFNYIKVRKRTAGFLLFSVHRPQVCYRPEDIPADGLERCKDKLLALGQPTGDQDPPTSFSRIYSILTLGLSPWRSRRGGN